MRHKLNRQVAAAAVALLAFGATMGAAGASAQSLAPGQAQCMDHAAPAQVRINGCTVWIQSGQASPGNLGVVYATRGQLYFRPPIGDAPHAIADMTKAIALRPDLPGLYFIRGSAYLKLDPKDYERGIADLRLATASDPQNEDAFFVLGQSYFERPQPDYKLAIANLGRAIALAPQDREALLFRGSAYSSGPEPDYASAIADFTRALSLEANDYQSLRARGDAYQRLSPPDYARAVADYSRSIELNSKNYFALLGRARVFLKQGQYVRAISDFDAAEQIDQDGYALYGRGIARLSLGQTEGGQADMAASVARFGDVASDYARWGVYAPGSEPSPAPVQTSVAPVSDFQTKLDTYGAGQLFALADELAEQGQADQSRAARRALISRFPESPLAATAAQQLATSSPGMTQAPAQRLRPVPQTQPTVTGPAIGGGLFGAIKP